MEQSTRGFAQGWADWMAATDSLSHSNMPALITQTSFQMMGENVLVGPAGMWVAQMENAWMNSPDHRENILNGAFYAVGVGVAYDIRGKVWVAVDFAGVSGFGLAQLSAWRHRRSVDFARLGRALRATRSGGFACRVIVVVAALLAVSRRGLRGGSRAGADDTE